MKLLSYVESWLDHPAATIGIGLGGTVLGSMIAGKIIRDPYQKERGRVDRVEKTQERIDKEQEQKRRAFLRQYLAKKKEQQALKPQSEGLVRTVFVGAPRAAWGFMTKHPAGRIGGALGFGAAFTAMDRAASYATAKRDKELALKAAKLDLEKGVGKEEAEKISKHAEKREKEGKFYDEFGEGVLPPKNWLSLGKRMGAVLADEDDRITFKRGEYSRKTNGYSPEHNPQTHSGYTEIPGEDHTGSAAIR